MKVLLLGKSGMLGSCFLKMLSGREDFEMYAFKKDDLDITDNKALRDVFEQISPDFVINCVAYTDVDACETEKSPAFNINADGPGEIARFCAQENAVLVHFSTDYVFDGAKTEGYKEDDLPSPINAYGESKLEGERKIANNMSDYYIIRTSWLFGENGKNFVDTMIKLSGEKNEIKVVSDQVGSPTYTKDLCEAIIDHFLSPYLEKVENYHERFLTANKKIFGEKLSFGIYHLTNFGITNWHEFAKQIFKLLKIDIKVDAVKSDEFVRPAKRPHCSILLSSKVNFNLRHWEKALNSYLELNYSTET